jgi:hypothetical protein
MFFVFIPVNKSETDKTETRNSETADKRKTVFKMLVQ